MFSPTVYITDRSGVKYTLTKKGLALQMTGTSMNEVSPAEHVLGSTSFVILERSDRPITAMKCRVIFKKSAEGVLL